MTPASGLVAGRTTAGTPEREPARKRIRLQMPDDTASTVPRHGARAASVAARTVPDAAKNVRRFFARRRAPALADVLRAMRKQKKAYRNRATLPEWVSTDGPLPGMALSGTRPPCDTAAMGMPHRSFFTVATLTALLALASPSHATRCLDEASDAAQIAAARDAIDAACPCFSYDQAAPYQSCVRTALNAQVEASVLRRECRGTVKRIYGRSVCGRPVGRNGPFAPCVSTTTSGRVGCAVKPTRLCDDTPSKSQERCPGSLTCMDAADANGDLAIAAPGDTGQCSSTSFTDNGNGTITDDLGLTWEKLSNDDSVHQFTATYTLADALAKVAMLNATSFAGHTDWRLPTVRELHTLLRPGPAPLVDPVFDDGCVTDCTVATCSCTSSSVFDEDTWSSTVFPFNPNASWTVDFRTLGPDAGVDGELDADANHVRAVRGP